MQWLAVRLRWSDLPLQRIPRLEPSIVRRKLRSRCQQLWLVRRTRRLPDQRRRFRARVPLPMRLARSRRFRLQRFPVRRLWLRRRRLAIPRLAQWRQVLMRRSRGPGRLPAILSRRLPVQRPWNQCRRRGRIHPERSCGALSRPPRVRRRRIAARRRVNQCQRRLRPG